MPLNEQQLSFQDMLDKIHAEDAERKAEYRKDTIIMEFLEELGKRDDTLVISLFGRVVAHGYRNTGKDFVLHVGRMDEEESKYVRAEAEKAAKG